MTIHSNERYADQEHVHRAAFAAHIVGIWTAIPGYIVSFDATKVTAVVQPGIRGQVLKSDGSVELVNMPLLLDVPVMFPRGGGCTLTFPVKANDECLVIFSSRSIDAWWQSGGIQAPSAARTHSLADGFAIVGPMSQAHKISAISTTKVQLRADDGNTYIELDPTGQIVNVKAPGGMTIDSPNVHFTGNILNDGYISTESNLFIDGDVTVDGTLTATVDVVGGGKHLKTHTHSGVQTGGGTSGPPV